MINSLVIAAALFVMALCTGGGWYARGVIADRDILELRNKAQADHDAAVQRDLVVKEKQAEALQKDSLETSKQAQAARSDAARARTVQQRLRNKAAGLATAASTKAPAAASDGAPAANAGFLLADLFSWADQRAGELAEYADQSRIAGLSCERSYDKVREEQ